MHLSALEVYRCPETGQQFVLEEGAIVVDGEIIEGVLASEVGKKYRIEEGMPNFTFPDNLQEQDYSSRKEYDAASHDYNMHQHVTFDVFCQDEISFRNDIVDLLHIDESDKVLEIAAGTGLNLPHIFGKLNGSGVLFVQDISVGMLRVCRELANSSSSVQCDCSIGNSAFLPFPDNYFDSALSFGGIGVFSNQERAIQEMVRVVKPGGRIVFGDEGVGPWLKKTTYGKILIDNNPFYSDEAPIDLLPIEARDVVVRWVLGGGFYLVDFSVGNGEPVSNFNYQIPGPRGGTHKTRYFGKLEGVTLETKYLAQKARDKSGKSMHEWLDGVVRRAADEELSHR